MSSSTTRRTHPFTALALAGFALTIGLTGCGGDDGPGAASASSPAASDTESSGTSTPSADSSETPSVFRQVLAVKQALSQAEVTTMYAHARVSAEVAGGKPGSFTASGRIDLLSDPERFAYSLRFADQDFVGSYVSFEGKTYNVGADGSTSQLPEQASRYLYYWLNPLWGAHSLDADISEVVAVTTEELGSAETTHYALKGVQHFSENKLRYTSDVWLDAEGHVVKRVMVLPDITVTMTFDEFDKEVVIDRPEGPGLNV